MRAAARLSPLVAAAVLLVVSLYFGDGLSASRLFWIGVFALAAGLGATALALAGGLPLRLPARAGTAAIGLLVAFVLWEGLTMVWSIAPDRSWAYLDRGLVYVAFGVLGLVVASVVRAPV